ncbi:Ankyrin repeat protein [Mycena venus]|uniref:Ankyrin repeat protein n=1 Tax=Mycena venus TaxID=2733690 RepID=A0A8H6YA76_9AGAR|nr:Ankyrin repeat protein [Mycena venus]
MVYDIKTVYDFHIHGLGSEQQQEMNSMERTQIIEWLSPLNFFLQQADIAQSQQKGTGGWLLKDPHFQQWESGSGKTLWCQGIPGAGKTVLLSMVVEHLGGPNFKHRNIGVACAYLNYKEAEHQTPVKLLAGFWRQLIVGRNVDSAKMLYLQHHEKGTTPTLDEVFNLLCTVITEFSKVFIVIDAVDEYPETQRQILLECVGMLGSTVNWMITSRPHIAPDSTLPNLETLEIHADEGDIRRYVDAQICMSLRLKKHVQNRADLREEIHSKITCTVDGMFLLAKLHIDSLSTKTTVKGVREALKTLPRTLNGSYDDAMRRIKEQNEESRNIANSTLGWVANAKRPLRVLELLTALAIEPSTKALDKDNMLDIDLILSVCAGLVLVDKHVSMVRLVHYTTQEYLESIQLQEFPDIQTEITCSLLTYLAFDEVLGLESDDEEKEKEFPLSGFFDDLPLLQYSQYCLVHAAGTPEHVLKDMVLEFLARASQWKTIQKHWWQPPWDLRPWPAQPSALWIAAAANLLETAKFILLNGAECNQCSDSPELSVASYYGHLEMVKLLIEHSADVNVQSEHYSTAGDAFVSKYCKKVIQVFIDCGVDMDRQGEYYSTALEAASGQGHKEIVQLLIEHGADLNMQGVHALEAASVRGNKEIVQLLIEHGAIVCVQDGHYEAAFRTVLGGYKDIFLQDIKYRADVNVQGGQYSTALQAASVGGHKEVVQLLIEHGANVNVQGVHALQAASTGGHKGIVQLLIEHGADVNVQGGQDGTALQAASAGGHKETVQLLIGYGADVNIKGGYHSNTLQAASAKGNKEIVQLIIEQGADVNAQGGEYGTALQAASAKGNQEIVQLLIEHGADVNVQGGYHNTALQAASSEGHKEIVQLLIEHGADVNVQGGHLLQATLANNCKDTSQCRRKGLLSSCLSQLYAWTIEALFFYFVMLTLDTLILGKPL